MNLKEFFEHVRPGFKVEVSGVVVRQGNEADRTFYPKAKHSYTAVSGVFAFEATELNTFTSEMLTEHFEIKSNCNVSFRLRFHADVNDRGQLLVLDAQRQGGKIGMDYRLTNVQGAVIEFTATPIDIHTYVAEGIVRTLVHLKTWSEVVYSPAPRPDIHIDARGQTDPAKVRDQINRAIGQTRPLATGGPVAASATPKANTPHPLEQLDQRDSTFFTFETTKGKATVVEFTDLRNLSHEELALKNEAKVESLRVHLQERNPDREIGELTSISVLPKGAK